MNPFDSKKNKVNVTTTIHPDFQVWLKEQNIPLAAWIEEQYSKQNEQGQLDIMRERVKQWMDRAYKQQDEIKALNFRVDYLEAKLRELSGKKVSPAPSKKKDVSN